MYVAGWLVIVYPVALGVMFGIILGRMDQLPSIIDLVPMIVMMIFGAGLVALGGFVRNRLSRPKGLAALVSGNGFPPSSV